MLYVHELACVFAAMGRRNLSPQNRSNQVGESANHHKAKDKLRVLSVNLRTLASTGNFFQFQFRQFYSHHRENEKLQRREKWSSHNCWSWVMAPHSRYVKCSHYFFPFLPIMIHFAIAFERLQHAVLKGFLGGDNSAICWCFNSSLLIYDQLRYHIHLPCRWVWRVVVAHQLWPGPSSVGLSRKRKKSIAIINNNKNPSSSVSD